jgi:hypothetical protein
MWFLVLWTLLRWGTQRRGNRVIERWKTADTGNELSLPGQTTRWIDEMLEPIRHRRQRIEEIVRRAEEIRDHSQISVPESAGQVPA